MSPVRSAVIGCGGISEAHLTFLSTSPAVELVGVCDRSPTAVAHARARFGVPAGFTDAAELLAATIPDVVHVLTPPQTHVPLIGQCMQAGADVFCEKPIALTAAGLDEVERCAEATGRRYMENHNYLYNDGILALDELVRAGRLGEVRGVDLTMAVSLADTHSSEPAGAIHDFITHATYLLLHFMGRLEVDVVQARWALTNGRPALRYDELTAVIGAGDVTATLRISGNARPMEFRVTLLGTEGRASTELYQPELRMDSDEPANPLRPLIGQATAGARLLSATARNLRSKLLQRSALHGLPRQLEAFYAAVGSGAPLPVSAAEIRATVELIDRLVAAA